MSPSLSMGEAASCKENRLRIKLRLRLRPRLLGFRVSDQSEHNNTSVETDVGTQTSSVSSDCRIEIEFRFF